MTPEILLALGLGVLTTHLTNFLKTRWPWMDGRITQLVVFFLCMLAAGIAALARHYAPPEFLASLATVFTTAVAWYEIAIKKRD